MALADYYARSAVAASQVLAGYDEAAISTRLEEASLGVGFTASTARRPEGRAALDLMIRVLARLYPRIALYPGRGADSVAAELASLAARINPRIEIGDGSDIRLGVWVGDSGRSLAEAMIYVGSTAWTARVGSSHAYDVGRSASPFGAGAAACLAAANVFRWTFLPEGTRQLDVDTTMVTVDGAPPAASRVSWPSSTLVGAGAIGQAALWALGRSGVAGTLTVVDPEDLDLGNLQRYVLGERSDVGRHKVAIATGALVDGSARLELRTEQLTWESFVQAHGDLLPSVLVALDSAESRRHVQATLPGWIANAWTQPGDLGVSFHRFGTGACLGCMYLPNGPVESEDAVVSRALGIPDRVMEVRGLLYQNAAMPEELLTVVAARLGVEPLLAVEYRDRSIRTLYQEGVCGGALLPIGRTGMPRSEVHVPLAHQSALAGVLLAAGAVAHARGWSPPTTRVLRVDLMRRLPRALGFQPMERDATGRCLCRDADFLERYRGKYSSL